MSTLAAPIPDFAADPVVDVTGLKFGWRDAPAFLCIDSFTLQRGERVFIKGSSGSGKSTLLGLIGGVLTPTTGRVRVLGHELDRLSSAQRDAFRAEHVGFIFQMFNLIPYLSVLDNVLLAARFSKQRRAHVANQDLNAEARRLLQALGLDDRKLHARSVTQLSIGQQQRVAAARALLGKPQLVIADEPTSSLDADARESFLGLLIQECRSVDAAILFVSHDTSLSHLFDRTVAMGDINTASTATAASVK